MERGIIIPGLEEHISETPGGKVCSKDDWLSVIEPLQAWVGYHGCSYVIEGVLSGVRPIRRNWLGVFIPADLAQRGDAEFKVMNETRVKLSKTNELRHVTDEFRGRPRLDQAVLGLRRAVAVRTDVYPNKFETSWEEIARKKIKVELIGLAHL